MKSEKVLLNNLFKNMIILILCCIVIGNLLSGFQGFFGKGGETADDFMMRYRESKYILNRINPFDVINGIVEVTPGIGSLWDIAGYTPWGMALGIILNFTFLPEAYARHTFWFFYLLFFVLSGFMIYYICEKKGSKKTAIIMALLAWTFPGWSTGLSWLNIGAIYGMLILGIVLILDEHPIVSGILLGIVATKPQLAAPFYLCLLFMKRYKTFFGAVSIPIISWITAIVLTSTSPLEMIIQFKEIMDKIGAIQGNWITCFSIYYNFDTNSPLFLLLGSGFCIMFAIVAWCIMRKNNETDKWSYFSIAAILSGMWTYSQAHDRTVLMVVLVCLFMKMKELDRSEQKTKLLLIMFCFSCVIDTTRIGRLLSMILEVGRDPISVLEMLKFMTWIAILFYLVCWKKEDMIVEERMHLKSNNM